MTREMHLLGESIQEITLYAWPIVWADNKYDKDSRSVLEMLRDWGEEFEDWWMSHDENWKDDHDWLEEVWRYAELKSREYVRSVADPFVGPDRDSNLQEFTVQCNFGDMMSALDISREEAFKKIREWADEFWAGYTERDAFEDYKAGLSYYDLVDKFIAEKIAQK